MIYARKYFWGTANPLVSTALLDAFVAQPEYLTYPHTKEEARAIAAGLLTDQNNIIWTTYSDKDLTGCVILTRIVPKVDALLHFLFLDRDLVSKRTLLKNLIGYCFTEGGLNRLSMEVPEGVKLERFARRTLGFRLEGELRPRNPELPACLTDNWVARQGSRREQAHFDGKVWRDVLLLRLLASEWVGNGTGGGNCQSELSQGRLPQSQEVLSEVPSGAEEPKTPKPPSLETSSPSELKT